ncbi:hypothetical protein NRY95_00730 [Xanthomonas campestris pv. phormiicola]|nr:hypothetical protein [Xanthomonas campestris pv. phormiicola]UYC16547.1 hypothetical protein NRY95_00730 [Xanthomonas campestris pv. phormiicola]
MLSNRYFLWPRCWWQLISLAPVAGILVLLYLLTYPTKQGEPGKAVTN